MKPISLEDILNCPSVPSLPAVAIRVLELTSDPDVEMDELAQEIRIDQGIATKILRTVNSSFYGLRKRCTSIEHALVMLGLGPVKSLVLGFSLVSTVNQKESEGGRQFDYLSYWKRDLVTAVSAKFACEMIKGSSNPDEAFLAGLFQDIGMVAMYRAMGTDYLNILAKAEGEHSKLSKHELHELELHHATVGAALCESWKIPHEIVLPVRYHEQPTACPQEFAQTARCVGLGNMISEVLDADDPTEKLRKTYAKGKSWLGLNESQIDDLIKMTGETAKELGALFSLDVSTVQDPNEVLLRADRQLIELSKNEHIESYSAKKFSELIQTDGDTDPLTGSLGKKSFTLAIREAFRSAIEESIPLSVCQVLISGYDDLGKSVGVEAQDELSICVTVMLRREFEPMGGIVFRISDAIYGVVIPSTSRTKALAHSQNSCTKFNEHLVDWIPALDGAEGVVRASFGVSTVDENSRDVLKTPEILVQAASRAVVAAKQSSDSAVRAFVPQRKAA